jgi:hypothetical protein
MGERQIAAGGAVKIEDDDDFDEFDVEGGVSWPWNVLLPWLMLSLQLVAL